MRALYVLSVWLHLLAAAFWVGGMLFLVFVLVPALRQADLRERAVDLIRRTARRFLWAGWGSFVVLVGTGIANLAWNDFGGRGIAGGGFWSSDFGKILALKIALVIVVLLSSAAHDFVLGPRATRLCREAPASPEASRAQFLVRWVGRANLVLGVLVIGMGVMLVRGIRA